MEKKDNNLIELGFYNACYAQGVKGFYLTLNILWHVEEFLIVEIYPLSSKRVAIIGNINYTWFQKYITEKEINTDIPISDYLDKYF